SRGQDVSAGGGSILSGNGWNAQCSANGAPSATQRRSSSFCSAESLIFESGGGIRSSSLSLKIRLISSLFSGLPATTTFVVTPLPVSNRNSAWRASASGPWQVKHLSDRMGRMSRSYDTAGRVSATADELVAATATAIANNKAVRRITAFRLEVGGAAS